MIVHTVSHSSSPLNEICIQEIFTHQELYCRHTGYHLLCDDGSDLASYDCEQCSIGTSIICTIASDAKVHIPSACTEGSLIIKEKYERPSYDASTKEGYEEGIIVIVFVHIIATIEYFILEAIKLIEQCETAIDAKACLQENFDEEVVEVSRFLVVHETTKSYSSLKM